MMYRAAAEEKFSALASSLHSDQLREEFGTVAALDTVAVLDTVAALAAAVADSRDSLGGTSATEIVAVAALVALVVSTHNYC